MILKTSFNKGYSLPNILETPNHIILSLIPLGMSKIIAGKVSPYKSGFVLDQIYDDYFHYAETKSEIPCIIGLGCIFDKYRTVRLMHVGYDIFIDKQVALEANPLDKYINRNVIRQTLKAADAASMHFIQNLPSKTSPTKYATDINSYSPRVDLALRLHNNDFKNEVLQLFGE